MKLDQDTLAALHTSAIWVKRISSIVVQKEGEGISVQFGFLFASAHQKTYRVRVPISFLNLFPELPSTATGILLFNDGSGSFTEIEGWHEYPISKEKWQSLHDFFLEGSEYEP